MHDFFQVIIMKNFDIKNDILESISKSSMVIKNLTSQIFEIEKCINVITKCFKNGNKLIIFGNGGSAADAQHIAAEFVGRFSIERESYPAIALTTDSSVLTSLANDYSYEVVFSRQCEGLVRKKDVVLGISTSGKSKNVKNGLLVAKKKGAITIGFLGNGGGTIKKIVDIAIVVDSSETSRIQEAHRTIYHTICSVVEKNLSSKKRSKSYE